LFWVFVEKDNNFEVIGDFLKEWKNQRPLKRRATVYGQPPRETNKSALFGDFGELFKPLATGVLISHPFL
jgi:hypothetical protein